MATGCKSSRKTIVFAGTIGGGKSSTCNFFMKAKKFEVATGIVTNSARCNFAESTLNDQQVTFIEAPLFRVEELSYDDNTKEILKAITQAKEGVSAVAFVVNISARSTKADEVGMKQFSHLYQNVWPYVFIIFTSVSSLGENEKLQNEHVQKILLDSRCPDFLKVLHTNTNGRYMLLENNNEDENYHKVKSQEFLGLVDEIELRNGGLYIHPGLPNVEELATISENTENANSNEQPSNNTSSGVSGNLIRNFFSSFYQKSKSQKFQYSASQYHSYPATSYNQTNYKASINCSIL